MFTDCSQTDEDIVAARVGPLCSSKSTKNGIKLSSSAKKLAAGHRIHRKKLGNVLVFSDIIVLVAKSVEQLQLLVSEF